MENASKALIIAGAILLAILIVSLGISVFQQASNSASGNNLDSAEINAFNSQWKSYEGSNKTASEVRTLYSAMVASNAAENKSGKNRFVTLVSSGTPTKQTTIPTITAPTVNYNTNYTITLTYDTTSGLVIGASYTTTATTP